MPFFQTKFKIEYNRFGPEGAKELAKGLFENRGLVQLKLGMQRLVTLIIGGDDMLDEGAIAIANVILTNHKLTRLSLGKQFINYQLLEYNEIGYEGAKGIASALMKNHTLTQLNLGTFLVITSSSKQDMRRRSKRISKCLSSKPHTHTFKYWYFIRNTIFPIEKNGFYAAGANKLATALLKNHTLTHLNFGIIFVQQAKIIQGTIILEMTGHSQQQICQRITARLRSFLSVLYSLPTICRLQWNWMQRSERNSESANKQSHVNSLKASYALCAEFMLQIATHLALMEGKKQQTH
eukprot:TRINITY_DN1955_c0_g1_i3.p1 TRINITY_DN1955_c0_g1~~TRINITY_DN1955_c0_g1_i3.p1  ORF type:complete len:294 (+),score=-15.33 TRINITY_DN1955_c0_g1_i3:1097-1978(+)